MNELPDDRLHDDFAAPAETLRPPAAGSRLQDGGRGHRHGSRGSSLDGPRLAPQGTENRGHHGRDEREDIGASARSSGTPATREETQGTTPARRAVSTDILDLPARVVVTMATISRRRTPHVFEELSGVSETPMIIRMTTPPRPQQRYDHRLRDLVRRTRDVSIATELGVPPWTEVRRTRPLRCRTRQRVRHLTLLSTSSPLSMLAPM